MANVLDTFSRERRNSRRRKSSTETHPHRPRLPAAGHLLQGHNPHCEDATPAYGRVDALAETTEGIAYDRMSLGAEASRLRVHNALAYRAKKASSWPANRKAPPERSSPPPTSSNTAPTPWKPTPTRSPKVPASSSPMTSSHGRHGPRHVPARRKRRRYGRRRGLPHRALLPGRPRKAQALPRRLPHHLR